MPTDTEIKAAKKAAKDWYYKHVPQFERGPALLDNDMLALKNNRHLTGFIRAALEAAEAHRHSSGTP